MCSFFSDSLIKYRKEQSITQNELLTVIQSKSNLFSRLDTVTISRWEHCLTTPALIKRIEILLMLNVNFDSILLNLIQQTNSIIKYNSLTTDLYLPPNLECQLFKITSKNTKSVSKHINEIKLISYFEKKSYMNTFFASDAKSLQELFKKLNLEIWLYKAGEELIGHAIFMKLASQAHWEFLNNQDLKTDLAWVSYEKNADNILLLAVDCSTDKVFKHLFSNLMYIFLLSEDKESHFSCTSNNKLVKKTLKTLGFCSYKKGKISGISNYDAFRTKPILEVARSAIDFTLDNQFTQATK